MNVLRDMMYGVGVVITSPFWAWRLLRTGKWRTDWKQRFGHVPTGGAAEAPSDVTPGRQASRDAVAGSTDSPRPTVLIHAVSVGEVNAIRQLVEQLASDAANPCRVVISATTNTGIARARALFEPAHQVVRYPFDFSRCVKRFLKAVQPDAVVLVELEVWPTFVHCCAKRNIPVAVVNGRLSERSFKRYKLIRPLMRSAFGQLAAVAVQTEQYAEHFKAMGGVADRVTVTDTMKWDTAVIEEPNKVAGVAALAAALQIDHTKPLIVAGSTGPGEEALLLKQIPADVQLLIAPRKPERFEEVAQLMIGHSHGGSVRRRTQCPDGDPPAESPAVSDGDRRDAGQNLFLLDTMGELRKAYALADAVIVGRSLIDLYGSDPIEPIALGKPTVIGPRFSDFRDTVEALLANKGIVVTAEPWPAIHAILDDPAYAQSLGQAGRETIVQRQGATRKHVELVRQMIQKKTL